MRALATATALCRTALQEYWALEADEYFGHADVAAFGAPGECGALVSRGVDKARAEVQVRLGISEEDAEAFLRSQGVRLYRARDRFIGGLLGDWR